MFKKIVIELESDKLKFYLFKNKKLISFESIEIEDIERLEYTLSKYYKLNFTKVYIILKNNIANYKIVKLKNINKNQISNLVKLNIMKYFHVTIKDYYFDTSIIRKYEKIYEVLIVIVNKHKIDSFIKMLLNFNFTINNITTYEVKLLKFLTKEKAKTCIVQEKEYIHILKFKQNVLEDIVKLDIFDKVHLTNELQKLNGEHSIYLINEVNESVTSMITNSRVKKYLPKLMCEGYVNS